MKKFLVLAFIFSLTTTYSNAVELKQEVKPIKDQAVQTKVDFKAHRDMAFEKRLNLTEVQKLKAREIRKSGHEKLEPVIKEIRNKKQEAEMVRRSRMAVQMQEEKLAVIDAELKVLDKKAKAIRKANMKEFESILTWQQKRILKDMKKEGRQRFQQSHHGKCPIPCPKPVKPQPVER